MISHALTIVINELNKHLSEYSPGNGASQARLGNVAEGVTSSGGPSRPSRDMLVFTVVNIKEEKALKNLPNYVRDETKLSVTYENAPVFLNFLILVTATHETYFDALSILSRGIRFFQSKNVFTQDNVSPASLTQNAPPNVLDQLETFKLIFDLFSPTLEEANHIWGTLGGKQYPFVLYTLRMLELKFKTVQSESGLITEVTSDFFHKKPIVN